MGQESQSHNIQVSKTARYFQLGDLNDGTKHIWFVLHGYGQLAEFFIRHFRGIRSDDTVVIAPEGLSRFYLDGTFGRVGASWMTKVDRIDEIQDQIGYLDQLHSFITSQASSHVQIHLLGFSQGVATAWRWMAKGKITPHNFILWAGSIPTQNSEGWIQQFRNMGFYGALGDQDQYIAEDKAIHYKAQLLELHPKMQFFRFSGGHAIDLPTLHQIHQKIIAP